MAELRAVVLGGSIAGLCAARALAEHFDHVTVVDRDALSAAGQLRSGVPQGRHVHALLVRGRRELERLFPGFERRMLERGAHELDFLRDFATLRPDGWWPPQTSGITTLFASRTLLESVVRELLLEHPRITLLERTDAAGLIVDGGRVRGVRVAARDDQAAAGELVADLVVDATGRITRAPAWLTTLGLPPPAETTVDAHAAYSTRWFRAPTASERSADWWWKGIWIDPKDLTRDQAGVLFPVEQGRWIVTLGGGPRCHPPTDSDGFAAALRRLRSPLIAEAVARAEPLSPVYRSHEMANRFRHYERWRIRLPGFVAVGDAVCKFNPVYGQGMTTAAVVAGILGDCVRRAGATSAELPVTFFRTQARFLRDPWRLATGADFRFPDTDGRRPPLHSLSTRYLDTLFATVRDDPVLRQRIGEVIHMLRPPRDLFTFPVLARVARRALTRAARSTTPADPVRVQPAA